MPIQNYLDLKTTTLLDKFGKGGHVPGSGSAAALMGLLGAKLLLTVATLTLGKSKYSAHHDKMRHVVADIETRLYPRLKDLFEEDAEAFGEAIAARKGRDKAVGTSSHAALEAQAVERMKLATDIPFRIADACLDLTNHAITIFDFGFGAARGDSGAGLSSAFAGANSAVFVVNLNLKTFQGSYWARQRRSRCDALRERLKAVHAAAVERIGVLRLDDVKHAKWQEPKTNFQITLRESYSEDQILEVVRKLQNILWRNRSGLWVKAPQSPIATFDPEVALRFLGYSLEPVETLGTFVSPAGTFEVAGVFEANMGRVILSRQFSLDEQLFTAAHELGHAVLHPQMDGAHRDRPKKGVASSKEPQEWEADKFATFFLMPPNVTREHFEASFGASPFVLNDDTAFNMGGLALDLARARFPTLRALSRHLAGLDRFAGQQIVPLAEQFRVSTEALAIRLEELELLSLR